MEQSPCGPAGPPARGGDRLSRRPSGRPAARGRLAGAGRTALVGAGCGRATTMAATWTSLVSWGWCSCCAGCDARFPQTFRRPDEGGNDLRRHQHQWDAATGVRRTADQVETGYSAAVCRSTQCCPRPVRRGAADRTTRCAGAPLQVGRRDGLGEPDPVADVGTAVGKHVDHEPGIALAQTWLVPVDTTTGLVRGRVDQHEPSFPSPATAASAPLLARQCDALRVAPAFAVSRVWFDRDVAPERPVFSAVSGQPNLDSIAVYSRLEKPSARWARSNGGWVVELHSYSCGLDDATVAAKALRD